VNKWFENNLTSFSNTVLGTSDKQLESKNTVKYGGDLFLYTEFRRRATGRAGFKKMSTTMKVLSCLQLPADLLTWCHPIVLGRIRSAPAIVMYLDL
jgi:hypothetical protein